MKLLKIKIKNKMNKKKFKQYKIISYNKIKKRQGINNKIYFSILNHFHRI